MEIFSEDGSKISINSNSNTEFGRAILSSSNDLTISRRHINFQPPNSKSRVSFHVLGKNPIWIYRRENGNTQVFRRSEKGEIQIGDSFCVSANKPILFKLKGEEKNRGGNLVEEEMEDVEGSEELGFGSCVDVSDIDPVKEFGFLVIGHEFDTYPKTRIRPINNWNWFLDESRADSDSDELNETTRSKGKTNIRRKRKAEGNEDEEWTGESDEDKDVISQVGKGKKARYTTRSKELSLGGVQSRKKSEQNKIDKGIDEDEEEDDDDEETLGGFIVSDEELDEEDEDEEEEEEEVEDEDDD
ncbi:hypothetical protein ACHQM5_001788 [Ranunculus cassubicifolius]